MDHTTLASFICELDEKKDALASGEYRVIPTSFDPDDPKLGAYPQLPTSWESGEALLKSYANSIAVVRIPPFWQMQTSMHVSFRTLQIAPYYHLPENTPVGIAALNALKPEIVITETKTLASFVAKLIESKSFFPPTWVCIQSLLEPSVVPDALRSKVSSLAEELHLFPGCMLLCQCEKAMHAKEPYFHLSKAYEWHLEKDRTLVTSKYQEPAPFRHLALPPFFERGICACGEPVYEPTYDI